MQDILTLYCSFFRKGKYEVFTAQYIENIKEPFAILEQLSIPYLDIDLRSYQGSVLVRNKAFFTDH